MMLSTTFTAQSRNFDVIEFAEKYNIDSDEYWEEGTIQIKDKLYRDSGFKFLITDEEDTIKHFAEIRQFLYEDSELLQELKEKKIEASFDMGFTINAPEYIARFVDLDKELIKQMADMDMGLSISAYLAVEDN